jgi:hypothetical protein
VNPDHWRLTVDRRRILSITGRRCDPDRVVRATFCKIRTDSVIGGLENMIEACAAHELRLAKRIAFAFVLLFPKDLSCNRTVP